ncbi:hypothetical protein Q3G72_027925 [Acer saccharum]|nr:hypothetical protein Q3G72_027925 [Acer saccharum]
MVRGQGEGSSHKKDPTWKNGIQIDAVNPKKGYVYVKCKFCNKVITGGVKRLKEYLGQTHKNIAACPKVPKEVKEEMIIYLKNFKQEKHVKQKFFDERVESGSYFGAPIEDMNSYPSMGGSSGNGPQSRGPMDRFLSHGGGDVPNDKEKASKTITPTSLKEQRNLVCLDIGRFFFENAISFNVARSPSYFNMLRSVANYGRGLKAPTMHELRTWILKEEYNSTTKIVDELKKTWEHTGVSILSDDWSDTRNRANPNDEESTEVGDEELNLEVDEMANEIGGSLQLIDGGEGEGEGEDDFGDEDNEIGFDDVDGFQDGLNNYEYDLPNDPNPNSVDENND